jgi:uncharacterized membrane protein YeaQ/YmgE (transglycosylase-associated protein family)
LSRVDGRAKRANARASCLAAAGYKAIVARGWVTPGSDKEEADMIGAIILGLVAGAVARLLIKNDAMERMGGLLSWLLTLVVGLVGAWVGWWTFAGLLGIGDEDAFDLGGIVGAIVGAVVVLGIVTWVANRARK